MGEARHPIANEIEQQHEAERPCEKRHRRHIRRIAIVCQLRDDTRHAACPVRCAIPIEAIHAEQLAQKDARYHRQRNHEKQPALIEPRNLAHLHRFQLIGHRVRAVQAIHKVKSGHQARDGSTPTGSACP
jgi:hypothetical protein